MFQVLSLVNHIKISMYQNKSVNENTLQFFLKSRKASPLHFYTQFMKDKLQCCFPIANGYPIVTSQCKKPKCINFIRRCQLSISLLSKIYNKFQVKCKTEDCDGIYCANTLLYQDDLEQLYDRNFTCQQKQRLKSVRINSDFQVFAQVDQDWSTFNKNINRKRIQILNQKIAELQNLQHFSNKKHQKLTIHEQYLDMQAIYVDLPAIYKDIKYEFEGINIGKMYKQYALLDKNISKQKSFFDICFLFESQDQHNLQIYRYFEQNQISKTTYFDLEIMQQTEQAKQSPKRLYTNEVNFQIAYDKFRKNIYLISEKGDLFYSNFTDRIDFLKQSILLSKIARIQYPQSFLTQISPNGNNFHIGYAFIYHQCYLYLIGGKYGQKNLNTIFRIKVQQQIHEMQQRNIKCQLFANIQSPLSNITAAIRNQCIYICGCNNQGQFPTIVSISLQKSEQFKTKERKEYTNQQCFKIQKTSLNILQTGVFAISGLINEQQELQRVSRVTWIIQQQRKIIKNQMLLQIQQSNLLTQQYSDHSWDSAIIIRKLQNNKSQLLFTKIQKVEGKWQIFNQIKPLNK